MKDPVGIDVWKLKRRGSDWRYYEESDDNEGCEDQEDQEHKVHEVYDEEDNYQLLCAGQECTARSQT